MSRREFSNIKDLASFVMGLPIVKESELQQQALIDSERAEWETALRAARARKDGPEAKKLVKAIDAGRTAVLAAEAALERAREKEREAVVAISAHGYACDLEIAKRERQLLDTADHRIGEFLEWGWGQFNDTVNAGGRLIPGTHRQLVRRIETLRNALTAAETLRLAVGVDIAAELERIRASITTIDERRDDGPTYTPAASKTIEAALNGDDERAAQLENGFMHREARSDWNPPGIAHP